MPADRRLKVLFLCTGNSCRSQMAEGWAKALVADRIDACSADTRPHGLNPLAVRVMAEAGIDFAPHRSKTPPRLAANARSDDAALPQYRAVRDQIRAFVATLPAGLDAKTPTPNS